MTATEPIDRHLRHGLLRTDPVVVSEGRRPERVYRSNTQILRANFFRGGVRASVRPDHHIEACREGSRLAADSTLQTRGPSVLKYAPHWRWITRVGLAATVIGLIIGIVAPGPLTGAVFPIGIMVLLVVAYAARPRSVAPPTTR
jgi:hypothetical protein